MTYKETAFLFLAFTAIIGWNVFLIQRDAKLFEAYNKTQPVVQTK